jgi:hypothetical protein
MAASTIASFPFISTLAMISSLYFPALASSAVSVMLMATSGHMMQQTVQ